MKKLMLTLAILVPVAAFTGCASKGKCGCKGEKKAKCEAVLPPK